MILALEFQHSSVSGRDCSIILKLSTTFGMGWEDNDRGGGLIQSSKDDGISSPQKTRMQSEKVQVKEGQAVEDQKQIRTSS